MIRRWFAVLLAVLGMVFTAGAAMARIDIRVDLTSQRMVVRTADGDIHNWAISSGRQGYRTPNGVYRPQRLERKWYSRKYGGNMPNAIFFRGGYAIHATGEVGRLGRPASHGCVRLHPAHAAKLFQMVHQSGKGATRIAITGVAPDSGTQFAKAKPAKSRIAAKARRGNGDWAAARNRILERDTLFEPSSAMGFRPMRSSGDWFLRR
jgi:L,D-transpeptidase catalytic domain